MLSEPIVSVDNLRKIYGKLEALKGISFDIRKREILGLLGPNGAGKSTFFSILATIIEPSEGDIFVNGASIRNRKDYVRGIIGYVPQEIALYPTLSGLDNLNFWAGLYGLENKQKKEVLDKVISYLDLGEFISRKVETYSGGMKRRLNIAVGILHNPSIIIMDEPFVGVDMASKKKIVDLILDLKSKGTAVVLSSHNTNEIEKLCDRIVLLEKGSIKSVGSLAEILKMYSMNYLEEVLLGL